MTNPMSLSAMTGLHASPKKHAGKSRRPKKPGGNHLAQLTQSHGAGDHHAAKIHALNYAKAITQHLKGSAASSPMGDDTAVTGDAPATNTAPPAATSPAGASAPSSLAALMRSRKK